VTELAVALERPKSTVAHHVKVLTEAGLVQVVRTRRVRAIEERFYGRTARMFYVGVERSPEGEGMPWDFNDFEVAARESVSAYQTGKLWGFIRHARMTEAQASEFWERMAELVAEFDQLSRAGKTVYGFAVPTNWCINCSQGDGAVDNRSCRATARFGASPVEGARPGGRVRRGRARWRGVGRASGGVLAG
jgi:DNA-binding transcriptional ArsR family regulator